MKKIFFFLILLLSMQLVYAQNKPTTQIPLTTKPGINLSQNVEKNKIPNGSAFVYEEPGKFKLYASFSNNKITGYYAIDGNGKRINATYEASSSVKCVICIMGVGDKIICYEVDCKLIPSPPINKKLN